MITKKEIIEQWHSVIIMEDFSYWKNQLNEDGKNQIDNNPSDQLKFEILNAYFKDANDHHRNIAIDQEGHDFNVKTHS